jgi:hypothetical protein
MDVGFFGKIKQGFSQLVGSTGNMQISLDKQQVQRGGSVTVTAVLSATGQLKGNSVNLEVTGIETVKYQVPVVSTSSTTGSTATASSTTETTEETKDNETFSNRQTMDPAPFVMNQGETRHYTGVVQIPQGVQPTYKGVDAVHVWKIRAYVDVSMGADIGGEAEVTVV